MTVVILREQKSPKYLFFYVQLLEYSLVRLSLFHDSGHDCYMTGHTFYLFILFCSTFVARHPL